MKNTVKYNVEYEPEISMCCSSDSTVPTTITYKPILKTVEEIIERHECLYCAGLTLDDDSGNCISCGAPRITRKEREQPMKVEYVEVEVEPNRSFWQKVKYLING